MTSAEDFQSQLDSIFSFAEKKRLAAVVVKSGDLHRLVGGYPGTDNRMALCCLVMRENMIGGDEIVSEPSKGIGATLMIKYQFPRAR